MEKWAERLSLFGFRNTDARRDAVLQVLEANSADMLDFLVFDTPVNQWDNIAELTAEELELLSNMSQIEKNIELLYGYTSLCEPC